MKSTSLSVRSSSSFAHVAIPGVYSSHSTFTAAMVSPSASVCRVSVIGRAKPVKTVDLGEVLTNAFAGGGHPKAASAAFRMDQELKTVDANPELEARRVAGDIDGILDVLVGTVVATQARSFRRTGSHTTAFAS